MKTHTNIPDQTLGDLDPGAMHAGCIPSAPSAIDLIEHVRELEKLEDESGNGIPCKARSIHVAPGDEVVVQFIPQTLQFAKFFRSGWHHWHSKSWLCLNVTSKELGGHRDCPLCSLGIESSPTWALPVLLLGREVESRDGMAWKDYDGKQSYLLRVDGGLFNTIADFYESNPNRFTFEGGIVWRIKRRLDWSWSVLPGERRPVASKFDLSSIFRSLQAPKLRLPSFDQELIQAIQANLNHAPQAGQVNELINAMPEAVFVPQIFGTKIPLLPGYMDFDARKMREETYVKKLEKSNVALLCGSPSANLCSVDVDDDAGLAAFIEVNPWARAAQFSYARRGGNFYFRLVGDYPAEVIRLIQGNSQWGEVRLGRCLTTISGYHPSGKRYVVESLGVIPEIEFDELKLPKGIEPAVPARRAERIHSDSTAEHVCRLDLDLLESKYQLRQEGGKLIARCPVCAEHGQDRKGQHLVIYPTGAYTCIVCRDTKRIYEIVGL